MSSKKPSQKNILKDAFGEQKRWVNFRIETRAGKTTKLPYSPVTGRLASSTDEKTWSTYDEALAVSPNVGIVFTPDQTLLGIDIDHCLEGNNIIHDIHRETIAQFLIEADTYTEISPSKTGLHVFLRLQEPLKLVSNKKAPFEIYTSGRYFTVTNDPYKEAKPIRTVSTEEALALLSIIGYPWKAEAQELPAITKESGLSDEQVLQKMFASRNGAKVKALYDGDLSDHKNDESSADMSLCSHLAFWTGKNAGQMERIWLGSKLGSRKKTQTRNDYRQRTISAAIASCKDVYETPSMKISKEIQTNAPDLEFVHTFDSKGSKVIVMNTENICRILRYHEHFKGRFRHDIFKNVLEVKDYGKDAWHNIEENDAITVQTEISVIFSSHFAMVSKGMCFDSIIRICKECAIDSGSDYLRSLIWDGKERLDSWLMHTVGAPDDIYHRAVASNWLKGAVKRVIEPGCKFDYVLVLEGPQGSKKSTCLSVLAGSLGHVETTMGTENKDFYMQFAGKMFVEFSEGETLSRTEVKRMKAIITTQVDKYRPPYERGSQDFPRRCVFAMTTNQEEYLKDETGNRRWLPVKLEFAEANIEWLSANREQLFAEAYDRVVNKKETVYEFPKKETEAIQQSRRISDENSDLVANWYHVTLSEAQRRQGITNQQVYRDCLHGGMASKPMDKWNEMKIAEILKNINLKKVQLMRNGIRFTKWYPENMPVDLYVDPEKTPEQIFNDF